MPLLWRSDLHAWLGDRRHCSLETGDAAGLEAGDAAVVWRSAVPWVWSSSSAAGLEVRLFAGWRLAMLRVCDAAMLRVWALAVQRSTNGSGSLVVKAASTMNVGLIAGVFGSGGLDFGLVA